MTQYIDLDQYRLRNLLVACRHQTITRTNVYLSSVKSSHDHLRAISPKIFQPPITKISLKIAYLKFRSNLPGASELTLVAYSDLQIGMHDGPIVEPDCRDSHEDSRYLDGLRYFVKNHIPCCEPEPAVVEKCLYTVSESAALFCLYVLFLEWFHSYTENRGLP